MSHITDPRPTVLSCVTEIVSSHLSHNAVPVSEVPGFIRNVYVTLRELELTGSDLPASFKAGVQQSPGHFYLSDVQADFPPEVLTPAVPIEDSIQPGYIVCLEDGKRLRMLKRYLRTQFGMTPEEYRLRWNLPTDYPMAAPEVIAQRREHARRAGLGRKRSVEKDRA